MLDHVACSDKNTAPLAGTIGGADFKENVVHDLFYFFFFAGNLARRTGPPFGAVMYV